MKKKLIISAFLLLGIGIFTKVLSTADWTEIGASLSLLTPTKIAMFLGVAMSYFLVFTWRWKIILQCHGHKIPFLTLMFYRMSGYGISYITPTQVGGEPVRIYFLVENHDMRVREATSSVLLDKLIEMTTFLAFVASGIIMVSFTDLIPDNTLIPISAFMFGCLVFFLYVFKRIHDGDHILTSIFNRLGLKKYQKLRKFEAKIMRTEQLLTDFISHKGHKTTTLPFVIALSLGAWSFIILEYYLLASFMGINLGFFESFLIATIPLMAYLLPVPAGLGMLETAQIGMFTLLGYSPSLAVAVVVLVRFKELFFSSIGFAYALTHGLTVWGKKKNSKKKESLPYGDKPRSLKQKIKIQKESIKTPQEVKN